MSAPTVKIETSSVNTECYVIKQTTCIASWKTATSNKCCRTTRTPLAIFGMLSTMSLVGKASTFLWWLNCAISLIISNRYSFNLVFQGSYQTAQQPKIRYASSLLSLVERYDSYWRILTRLRQLVRTKFHLQLSKWWRMELLFPYRSSSMNRSQLVSYQMNSKLATFTRSSSPGNPTQRKHQIIAESRWHASSRRFWRNSCIVRYTNI